MKKNVLVIFVVVFAFLSIVGVKDAEAAFPDNFYPDDTLFLYSNIWASNP